MMTINEQELRAIAFVAARCRPHGAHPWDEPGIVANLRKVAHLNLAEVAIATIRAAANRQAENPGVIAVTTGEHWREKVTESQRPVAPRREDQCADCGRPLEQCSAALGCGNQTRRHIRGDAQAGATAARAALRANRTEESA
jgi:hypothetical protein